MAVKDLGTKLSCQSCEAKFYDLKKKTPVCPKCDTEYVPVKPRTRRAAVKAAPQPAKEEKSAEAPANDDAPKTEDEALAEVTVEVEDSGDEQDNSLIEGGSDDGDKEDVAGVIENIDIPTESKES